MFGPPEVITGRLMSGAGAAPMTAAATEYTAAGIAYEVSIDRLTALMAYLATSWQGEAAMAMQRTVMQFIMVNRMLQAQVLAQSARTAAQAAAFTEAYTTMAQMVEIVENRVTTATLHATNFLGFNTVPIGVKEGQYMEMWMRDVAVQTNYLAQTVANTTPVPFAKLPPLTGVTSFPRSSRRPSMRRWRPPTRSGCRRSRRRTLRPCSRARSVVPRQRRRGWLSARPTARRRPRPKPL